MGKGDRRSRKGKIWAGTYGVSRKKKKKQHGAFVPKVKKAAPKAVEATDEATEAKAKKAPAKKAAKPAGEKTAAKKKPAAKKSEE